MFQLGDIVAIKMHPFTQDSREVILKAGANFIPPLMIVTELLEKQNDDVLDLIQVKCLYYSHRKNKIISNWFTIQELKLIEANKINYSDDSFFSNIFNDTQNFDSFINENIVLKTVDFELGKRKASLSYASTSEPRQAITASLNFLPPLMIIRGVENDRRSKQNNKDREKQKTKEGHTFIRTFSKKLFKCKWFNPEICAFSEDFISPYAFTYVSQYKESFIKEIGVYISGKKYLRVDTRIILPKNLYFNHYKYELEYYDFFESQTIVKDINKITVGNLVDGFIKINDDKEFICAPTFSYCHSKFIDVKEFINTQNLDTQSFSTNKYRIHYKDKFDNLTVRMITNCEVFSNDFIVSDCKLRNAKRIFRIAGILKIELLNF